MIAKGELPPIDYAVHADTTWERESTYQFAKLVTPWLERNGVKVVTVRDKTAARMLEDGHGIYIPAFLTNDAGEQAQLPRTCTNNWKVAPVRRFISDMLAERGWKKDFGIVKMIMGISWDEALRMRHSDTKYIENEYPLIDQRIRRTDCIYWLENKGLPIPYKSACVFCPYHSRAAWKELGRRGNSDLAIAIDVDEKIRAKFTQKQLFVHPSRKPLVEAVKDDGQLELWPEATCDGGYCFV